jgi:hypothetical protein
MSNLTEKRPLSTQNAYWSIAFRIDSSELAQENTVSGFGSKEFSAEQWSVHSLVQ